MLRFGDTQMDDLFVLFPDFPCFPKQPVAERVAQVRQKAEQMQRLMKRSVAERQRAVERMQRNFYAKRGVRRRR